MARGIFVEGVILVVMGMLFSVWRVAELKVVESPLLFLVTGGLGFSFCFLWPLIFSSISFSFSFFFPL